MLNLIPIAECNRSAILEQLAGHTSVCSNPLNFLGKFSTDIPVLINKKRIRLSGVQFGLQAHK